MTPTTKQPTLREALERMLAEYVPAEARRDVVEAIIRAALAAPAVEGERRCAYCKQPMGRVCDSCDKGFYEGQPEPTPQEPPERIGNRTANEWLSDLSLKYPTHTFEELEALVAAAFRAAPPQEPDVDITVPAVCPNCHGNLEINAFRFGGQTGCGVHFTPADQPGEEER